MFQNFSYNMDIEINLLYNQYGKTQCAIECTSIARKFTKFMIFKQF